MSSRGLLRGATMQGAHGTKRKAAGERYDHLKVRFITSAVKAHSAIFEQVAAIDDDLLEARRLDCELSRYRSGGACCALSGSGLDAWEIS